MCKLCVQSSTGRFFVQALQHKAVLASACASIGVQSVLGSFLCNHCSANSIGRYFVQALQYKAVLGSIL